MTKPNVDELTALAPTPSLAAMLRVGFIGSGLIAWAHGLGLKAMIDGGVVDAAIVAVHDQHERRARGFAEALGGDDVEVVADAAEVARRCDAVWVCTPTSAHREAVDEALAAGCAVFCEKPLHVDFAGAAALVEAARAAGVASQCGLVLRSAPVFRALRDLVQGGTWARRWRRCSATTSTSPFRGRMPHSGGPTPPRPAAAA